ncbi:hypothetical protein V7S43_013793 [Phytophthora oleae]|uniref:Uncharacterized protein n=1 Tax=Phytophthora oleae TaxID=2107226 RepID=A0ABD3F2Y9_9STRA
MERSILHIPQCLFKFKLAPPILPSRAVEVSAAKMTGGRSFVPQCDFLPLLGLILKLRTPIHKRLAHFEKDTLCLSVVYQQFVLLKRDTEYHAEFLEIDEDSNWHLRTKIQARWELIDSAPMRIAYMLDHTKNTDMFTGNSSMAPS